MDIRKIEKPEFKNEKFRWFIESGGLNGFTPAYTGLSNQQVMLVGGACRSFVDGQDPNDFDVFIVGFADSTLKGPTLKEHLIAQYDLSWERIFTCPAGLLHSWKTPNGKVQLITPREYRDIADMFQSFDFTICQAAFDGKDLYYTDEFWKDVTDRKLTLLKMTYPLATMNRMYRFKSYGYNIFQASEDFLRQTIEGEFPDADMFRHYID